MVDLKNNVHVCLIGLSYSSSRNENVNLKSESNSWIYFDILDYNPLFSDVHCGLSVYLNTNVNKNTTTQDIGQGSNPIHIKSFVITI
jgi:hypothetical protein